MKSLWDLEFQSGALTLTTWHMLMTLFFLVQRIITHWSRWWILWIHMREWILNDENSRVDVAAVVNKVIKIPRTYFLFTYLGVPIYYSRRENTYYKENTKKVCNQLFSWNEKLIFVGGGSHSLSMSWKSCLFISFCMWHSFKGNK